jgi:hypothetical protein
MTMPVTVTGGSGMLRLFAQVRAEAMSMVGSFLKTPIAWIMIVGVAAGTWVYSDLREGNRRACAATSVTLDQQTFRDVVMGNDPIGGGVNFQRACEGMALPGPIWSRMRNTQNWAWLPGRQ